MGAPASHSISTIAAASRCLPRPVTTACSPAVLEQASCRLRSGFDSSVVRQAECRLCFVLQHRRISPCATILRYLVGPGFQPAAGFRAGVPSGCHRTPGRSPAAAKNGWPHRSEGDYRFGCGYAAPRGRRSFIVVCCVWRLASGRPQTAMVCPTPLTILRTISDAGR